MCFSRWCWGKTATGALIRWLFGEAVYGRASSRRAKAHQWSNTKLQAAVTSITGSRDYAAGGPAFRPKVICSGASHGNFVPYPSRVPSNARGWGCSLLGHFLKHNSERLQSKELTENLERRTGLRTENRTENRLSPFGNCRRNFLRHHRHDPNPPSILTMNQSTKRRPPRAPSSFALSKLRRQHANRPPSTPSRVAWLLFCPLPSAFLGYPGVLSSNGGIFGFKSCVFKDLAGKFP